MLSLIITTYNRAEQLKTALQSVLVQSADPALWECVVVNNNSSDNTNEVVNTIINENGSLQIRLVEETKQGLSHARNCGVRESIGDIVVFVDDDEVFVEEFVQSYIDFFDRHPEVSVAGGGCEPRYEGSRPKWLSPIIEAAIAFPLDMGATDRPFQGRKSPGGGNMALRRKILTSSEVFNGELGRKGDQLLGGEEVELFGRLREGGEEIWWVAGARMFHIIPESKITLEYLRRLWFNIGVSQRKRSLIDGSFGTLYLREAMKWGAASVLAILYTLTLRPSKGAYLLRMRYNVTRGIIKRQG